MISLALHVLVSPPNAYRFMSHTMMLLLSTHETIDVEPTSDDIMKHLYALIYKQREEIDR